MAVVKADSPGSCSNQCSWKTQNQACHENLGVGRFGLIHGEIQRNGSSLQELDPRTRQNTESLTRHQQGGRRGGVIHLEISIVSRIKLHDRSVASNCRFCLTLHIWSSTRTIFIDSHCCAFAPKQ